MTKKIFVLLSVIVFAVSCSEKKDRSSIMVNRYNAFLKILPDDTASKFKFDSKEYVEVYKEWQTEAAKWIENTLAREEKGASVVTNIYKPDMKEYAIGLLTNKFYERENPYELMEKVYKHTKILAKEVKSLENDEKFKSKLDKIKKDEAIENFTTEDTVFYFIWNYMIMLDRPRRFQ